MRIHLKQPDIERALQNYLATEYGVPIGSKSFEVEFKAGRKGSGLSATLIVGEATTEVAVPVVAVEFPEGTLAQVVEEAIQANTSPAAAALTAAMCSVAELSALAPTAQLTPHDTPVKPKRAAPVEVAPAPLVFEPAVVEEGPAEASVAAVEPAVMPKAKPGFNSLFS